MVDESTLAAISTAARSIGAGFAAVATFLRVAYGVVQAWRARRVRRGLYKGYWIDPSKREFNYEVLRVRRRLDGFGARPVYIHKRRHNYRLVARPYLANRGVFAGVWHTKGNGIYRGTALFHLDERTDRLDGQWIGPHGNGASNGGRWVLDRYDKKKTEYLRPHWRRVAKAFVSDGGIKQSLVEEIIKRHEANNGKRVTAEGIQLSVGHGAFVPTLGKVSIPLIKYSQNIVRPGQTVLDLGTGSGFYAIYLAQHCGALALGVDISSGLVEQALQNAAANGVANQATFRIAEVDDMFSSIDEDEKFDVIVANLPFSRVTKVLRSCRSPYYWSFKGTRRILEQLILGTLSHARATSRLVFCYGESGYTELLYDLIHLSAWEAHSITELESDGDDRFYIFDLRISNELKSFFE